MRTTIPFRTFQTISDLRGVAQHCGAEAIAYIAAQNPKLDHAIASEQLATLIHSADFKLPEDDSYWGLLSALQAAALGPIEHVDGFTLSVSILLADELHDRLGFDEPDHGWQLIEEQFSSLPAPRRAAIMNGYKRVYELFSKDENNPVSGTLCVTRARDELCAPLIKIAQRVTANELDHISRADYGYEPEKHLSALKKVIFEQNCRITRTQYWNPSEVIELISHIPSETGFVPCTAVLLINSIYNNDSFESTDYRWLNNADYYANIPPSIGVPILRGFRHLYENVEWWNPYFVDENCTSKGIEKLAIPYFDT